jgi:uncharacterized protein with GYD domain
LKDAPRRLDAAKKALKDMSGEFKSFFLTMGDYDIVAIYESSGRRCGGTFQPAAGDAGKRPDAHAESVS